MTIIFIVIISIIIFLLLILFVASIFFFTFTLTPANKSKQSIWTTHDSPLNPNRHKPETKTELSTPEQEAWVKEMGKDVYITHDGTILHGKIAKLYPASHDWLILSHGYKGHLEEMAVFAKAETTRYSMNALLFDQRAHGQSEGKAIGMGWLEKDDLKAWINYVIGIDKDARILLHGVSMGAATVLNCTGMQLPKNVKAAIADCSYTSVDEEFTHQLHKMFHLPRFPFIPITSLVCRIRAGYTFKEASPIDSVRHSHTPTLFIHGMKDSFVPYSMEEKLYKAATCPKMMVGIMDARHAVSCQVNPTKYQEAVDAFLQRYFYTT